MCTRRWPRPVCASGCPGYHRRPDSPNSGPWLPTPITWSAPPAARDLLTDGQRTEARVAALDAAAASGIVAVHECAGPEIGGLDDWYELRTLSQAHGVQVTGYWGEAVTSPAQARAVIEDTGAAGLAG